MSYQYIDFEPAGDTAVLSVATAKLVPPVKNQVLIKVAYAGVNGPDIAQRKGLYPAPKNASPVLGLEVSGEIVAVGEAVDIWDVGDQVCALVPGGGYAEYVLTHAEHCLSIPAEVSLEQAACLPETFFTVWSNLFMRAGLQAGESVLIHGGSGGIGSTAIALAKAMGSQVITTVRGADKVAYCKALGAEQALNTENDAGFADQVLAFTGGRGVNVVLDMVGGDYINQNLKCLAMDGRMMSIAMLQSPRAQVDIFRLMAKRILWSGSTLRPQTDAQKASIAAELQQIVWPKFQDHSALIPHIFAEFSLHDCQLAHQLMESGKHNGKIVINMD